MTKQEEIREDIINWFLERNPDKNRSWAEWETKILFIRQSSKGVVIKVNEMNYYVEYEPLIKVEEK